MRVARWLTDAADDRRGGWVCQWCKRARQVTELAMLPYQVRQRRITDIAAEHALDPDPSSVIEIELGLDTAHASVARQD